MIWEKVLAIDGPSGSGKSTVARALAERLNYLYVDTGAMFRAVGYVLEQSHIPFVENDLLRTTLSKMYIQYGTPKGLIFINGQNLSDKIREHRVSALASQVSQLPSVRTFLLDFQRTLARERFCVMEGRDIGTVVFPKAFCKIYLTASDEVRAKRRHEELKAKGQELSFEKILGDVRERDAADRGRAVAPLRQAEDALLLDTSYLNTEEVISSIMKMAQERAKERGPL